MAQTINLDITPGLFQPVLHLHQNDVGREFVINVRTKDGYTIPTGATAEVQATKPSGMGFTVAGTISGESIAFVTTEGMTDEWGRFPAQIQISSGGTVIFAANFIIELQRNVHPDGTTDGQQGSIIPELTLLVERVENAAAAVLDTTTVVTTLPAGSQATYSFDEETRTATFGIPQGEAGAGAAGVVASAYSASKTYAVGDYVIHNSNLYRCNVAITTAESFTASHWTQVVLADDVTNLKSDFKYFTLFETKSVIDAKAQNRPSDGKHRVDLDLTGISGLVCTNNGATKVYVNTMKSDGTAITALGLNAAQVGTIAITNQTAYIVVYADTYPINVQLKAMGTKSNFPDLLNGLQNGYTRFVAHYTTSSPATNNVYASNLLKGTKLLIHFKNPTRTNINVAFAVKKIGDATNYFYNTIYFKDKILLIELDDNYDYLLFYRNSAAANFDIYVDVETPTAEATSVTNSAISTDNGNLIDIHDVQISNNVTVVPTFDLSTGFITFNGTNGADAAYFLNDSKSMPAGDYVARFIFKKPPKNTITFGIANGTNTGYADFRGDNIGKEYVARFTLTETKMLNGYYYAPKNAVLNDSFSFWLGTASDYDRYNSFDGHNLIRDYDKTFYLNDLLKCLDDKKCNFLGDSITYGSGASFPFTDVLSRYSTATIRNYGIHGSTLQSHTGTYPMCERYADMDNDADIVAVMGGTNDYWLNLPLGSFGDTTGTTYYGALDVLIRGVIAKYPRAFFYMVTPPHGYIANDYTEETRSNIGSMADVVDAIKKVAGKYSVPVLDLFNEAGMYPRISQQKTAYYSDGVHLNNNGQSKLAYLHGAFIRSHYNY